MIHSTFPHRCTRSSVPLQPFAVSVVSQRLRLGADSAEEAVMQAEREETVAVRDQEVYKENKRKVDHQEELKAREERREGGEDLEEEEGIGQMLCNIPPGGTEHCRRWSTRAPDGKTFVLPRES